MVIGERWSQYNDRATKPHQVFTLLPRQLTDGRWVWLEIAWRVWWFDEHANYAGDDSKWLYALRRECIPAEQQTLGMVPY